MNMIDASEENYLNQMEMDYIVKTLKRVCSGPFINRSHASKSISFSTEVNRFDFR